MVDRECVYVIGAGFSAGLDYPLTFNLLLRLWQRLGSPNKRGLRDDLKKIISFHHPGFDPLKFTTFPNVEDLLSEMFVNDQLFHASRQYEGKFTQKKLREVQQGLLLEIASWFHELSEAVRPQKPYQKWLRLFRDKVRKEDAAIISFNWDLVIDQLLFHDEISAESYGFGSRSASSPILLKPHGSLNWYEQALGQHLLRVKRALIYKGDSEDDSIYAFREFRAPVSSKRVYMPLIVPPVIVKDFAKPVFKTLWNECTDVLSTAKKVFFLGYSMPTADLHAQFIMRCGFHNQNEGKLAEDGKRTKPTGPAEVIIVNPDRSAAQRIATVVGQKSSCKWISVPVADWILKTF